MDKLKSYTMTSLMDESVKMYKASDVKPILKAKDDRIKELEKDNKFLKEMYESARGLLED
jgi:hypothetical protein